MENFDSLFHYIISKQFITLAIIVFDIVAISSIIWRSQGVERTLSWIFAVIAIPVFGAFFYFFLTHQPVKLAKKRKRKFKYRSKNTGSNIKAEKQGLNFKHPVLNLAYSLTGFEPGNNNQIEILTESDNAFEIIQNAVRSAEIFVWVEFYIIKRDSTGKSFLKLLADAAQRGIEVRILYDAFGSSGLDSKGVKMVRRAGGIVNSFNPFNPFRSRWSFHLRNHRKLIVIDGKTAFTGGMNIGNEYSGRNRRKGLSYFRDTHMQIEGVAVQDLMQVFMEDWAFSTGGEVLPTAGLNKNNSKLVGNSTIAVLPSDPDQLQNTTALVFFEAINQAKKTIYLTSPYFIPDEPLMQSLICASLRGVDVRIIVPGKSDVILARQAAISYYSQLIPLGVKVYEYMPSMLHAKTLIIDNLLSVVGSANMDIRSFRLNFELNALILDENIAQQLSEKFYHDMQMSKYIEPGLLNKRGMLQRFTERIVRLLSPLL